MRIRGFTLAELLVALAIGAMLLALAAPGLARQRGAAALRAAANETLAALQLARRIALARGQSVTVCPERGWYHLRLRPARSGCCSPMHRAAWTAAAKPADELLQRWCLPRGVVVTGTRGYAAFQPRPGAATTVTFQFCHRAAPAALAIVVSQTGRPRVDRQASVAPVASPAETDPQGIAAMRGRYARPQPSQRIA